MTSDPISKRHARTWRERLDREMVVRIVKFGVVGASGVPVNLVVFELFHRYVLGGLASPDLRLVAANVAGVAVSIFTNFLLNDLWTWGDRSKGGPRAWVHRLGKFYVAAYVATGVQVGVSWVSYRVFWRAFDLQLAGHDVAPPLSVLTGIACGMAINFLASHLWAFADAEEES